MFHPKHETFIAPYRFTLYKNLKRSLSHSEHGYWITPKGDVYSLDEAMSHGRVAAAVYPDLFKEILAEYPNAYVNSIATEIDLAVVSKHKWFRVSIVAAIGDINFSWGSEVTPQQIVALETIVDTNDPGREVDLWYEGGPGSLTELKAKIRETACTSLPKS